MKPKRLHPAFCLRYLKLLVLPCVAPVFRALSARDAGLVQSLLWDDAYFLAALLALIFLLWRSTSYTRSEAVVSLGWGLFFRRRRALPLARATALVTRRTPVYRLLGAVECRLYFEAPGPGPVAFPLSVAQARALADALFPCEDAALFYKPQGKGSLGYALLSTDALAGLALTAYTAYRLYDYLDLGLAEAARRGFLSLEAGLALFLPAGAALAAALGLLLACAHLFRALTHTLGFQVGCTPRVLVSRGGLFTRQEMRVYRSKISTATLGITPLGRLARHYPLYVSAGGFDGAALPIFLYTQKDEARVRELLPAFRDPFAGPWCVPREKPVMRYLALPAGLFAVAVLALALCLTRAPALAPLCAGAALCSLFFVAVSAEGIFREGVQLPPGGAPAVSFCRFFSRRITQFYTENCLARLSAASTGEAAGRCTLTLTAGDRRPARARGIPLVRGLEVLERLGGAGVPFA